MQLVIMSGRGFAETMAGPVRDTKRDPEELIQRIKADFLDFSISMKSPDFVKPLFILYKKDDLTKELEDVQKKINAIVLANDLTETCIAFELPVYGFLTRLEAVTFVTSHTKRHIHQLKNIIQNIKQIA